jgi:predicted enzyme related to lactoylglutathione lyase
MFASGTDGFPVCGRREVSELLASVAAMNAIAKFGAIALDCREPRELARFYASVLDLPINRDEPDWVQLTLPGQIALAFQLAPDHVPPVWPSAEHPQQMHLDLDVTDLDAAEERVVALGARKHEHQPGTTFRVFLDPAGHLFCLCLD